MVTIYVLTSGEYSDYGIHGVFSSKEEAQEWIDCMKWQGHTTWTDYEIEEYELDPSIASEFKKGCLPYFVFMREGIVVFMGKNEDLPNERFLEGSSFKQSQYFPHTGNIDVIKHNVWARSEEHAVKIASERHAMMTAENLKEWRP